MNSVSQGAVNAAKVNRGWQPVRNQLQSWVRYGPDLGFWYWSWPGFLEDKLMSYLYRYILKVLCNCSTIIFDVLEE